MILASICNDERGNQLKALDLRLAKKAQEIAEEIRPDFRAIFALPAEISQPE